MCYGNAACVVSALFEELLITGYVALKNFVVCYPPLLCPSDTVKNVPGVQTPPLAAEGPPLIMHQVQLLSVWLIKA